MKKTFLLTLTLFAWLGQAAADEFVVGNVSIPKGGKALLEVALNNPEVPCVGFQFTLALPEGISVAQRNESLLMYDEGTRMADLGFTTQVKKNDDGYGVLSYNASVVPMAGTSGTVILITLQADEAVAIGTVLNASLLACKITNAESESILLADELPFTITVAENRTLLDENATEAPEASDGAVDVRVKRTFDANVWNTICLPFAMTAAQVQEAFGSDVELADFTGAESTYDDAGENIIALTVKFQDAAAIEANHPYIIKVSEPVAEFTVDGVTIEPDEASVDCDRIGKGTKKDPYRYNSFVGNYVAQTELAPMTLFLSGNKFYYSAGLTKIKAFRGYFDFYDVLTDVEEAYSEVKMDFDIDGVATRIDEMQNREMTNDEYFDLGGRRITKPTQRGVYIVDGKKVLMK